MRRARQFLMAAALLATAIPTFAQTESAPDDREKNRRKLERLKDQPEAMARLRRQAVFFLTLPEERRMHVLDLDQKLRKEPAASRHRLEKVLERYAVWLGGLDPAERKKIKDAPDSKARLAAVKKIRAEEWLKTQPRAVQEELAKLDGQRWANRIHALRDQERRKTNYWMICTRFWEDLSKGRSLPARPSDLDGEVTSFVNEYLLPRLDAKEKDRLKKAEGHWPHYPLVLVTLADRHPPALPDPRWPRDFKDLPRDVQKRILNIKKGGGLPKRFAVLAKQEGLDKAASQWTKKPFAHELWPKNEAALSDPVKKFISTTLKPALHPDELVQLSKAEQQGWPNFPLMLKKLAEEHALQVPWHTLPGNPEVWDKYRLKPRLPR